MFNNKLKLIDDMKIFKYFLIIHLSFSDVIILEDADDGADDLTPTLLLLATIFARLLI